MTNSLYKNFPNSPGVYLMKDQQDRVIYVGKAANLHRRVSSYFNRAHDARIEKLVSEIKKIDYKETPTVIEALVLEAQLIKKYEPQFNVKEKDDKSFLYVELTKEKFPRLNLVRGKDDILGERFGPFTSATSIREALKILRRIFPWSTHGAEKIGKFKRPCLDYEIGLCPGTCIGAINQKDYKHNVNNIKLFFEGKKVKILTSLKKEMKGAAKKMEFERAEHMKRQIFSLEHIHDVALINDEEESVAKAMRIEGYDISNISGTSAVGSMVVFLGNSPAKNEYRKFKIKGVIGANDTGMMREVLERRFNNKWVWPSLILVDGGAGQVNAAKAVLLAKGIRIPIIGLAKGPERKNNELVGEIPDWTDLKTLIKVRDEAHRFAVTYHRKIRDRI